MALVGTSSFTAPGRSALGRGGPEEGLIVVWLWGEHDISTDGALSLVLARAMAIESAGLVLDMSEVDFIGASTLGTIVRAREYLRKRSSTLTVRSPSAVARRTITACDLDDLFEEPRSKKATGGTGEVLNPRAVSAYALVGTG